MSRHNTDDDDANKPYDEIKISPYKILIEILGKVNRIEEEVSEISDFMDKFKNYSVNG